jgi:hypothetical protein
MFVNVFAKAFVNIFANVFFIFVSILIIAVFTNNRAQEFVREFIFEIRVLFGLL